MIGARKSAKYIFIGNSFSRIVTFAASIVLARILFPEDYGYLLMAGIVSGFIEILGNSGFEIFYLQEKIHDEIQERNILDIIFKLRFVVNIFLFFTQLVFSYVAEKYYGNEIIGELLRIFAFTYLLNIAIQINIYVLRKKIDFRPEVLAGVVSNIVGSVAKVTFAYLNFGAISFAYGSLIGTTIFMLIILYYQKFVPRLTYWNSKLFQKIYFFGKHYLIAALGNYFSNYIDKIIIASHFNPSMIGFYNFAFAQADNIKARTTRPMGKLIISYIAKHKSNFIKIYDSLVAITYFELTILLPLYIILLFYTEFIINFIFGKKWVTAALLMQIFLARGLIGVIFGSIINLLTGLGYPSIQSKLSLVNMFVLALALLIVSVYFNKIEYYAMTFVFINILFAMIKGSIGLAKIDSSIFIFLKSLHLEVILIYIVLLVSAIMLIQVYVEDKSLSFIFSLLSSICIFILLHAFVFKNIFLESLAFVAGKEHKVLKLFDMFSLK